MLPALAGFDARPTADGYILVPRDGARGFIRYERRVRPLRSVSVLLAPRLAGMPTAQRGPTVPVVTDEGEHAARVSVDGGAGLQRELGFVFGDDFVAIVDATCTDRSSVARFADAVDALVRGIVLGAPLRRRRYAYAMPMGRRPRVRDLETDWIADDTLTVFPAERVGSERALAIASRDGFVVQALDRIDADTTVVIATAMQRWRAVEVRAINGWMYAMELVASSARSLDPLRACMASIESLSAPPARTLVPVFEVD